MPDEKLPEGTDKIIAGASGSPATGSGSAGIATGPGTSAEGNEGTLIMSETTNSDSGSGTASTPPRGGKRDAIVEKIRSGRDKLSSQAADKTRGLVGQGLERGAEALSNVSRLVGDTAEGLDERLGPEYGDYARRAATAIEDAANNIATKDADELIDDTREFVRRSPGVALAGAAIVGFAVARLIKSGLARDDDDNGRSGRSGGSRET